MAARKSSRGKRKYKTKYRVKNWREYEAGLRARGDLTIWLSPEVLAGWTPAPNGRRGAQRQFSDLAIELALTLRLIFHQPLRQTEGLMGSLLRLLGLAVKAPDHSTLSRRSKTVEIPDALGRCTGPIHLIVDSSGLKIFGAGEWHTEKWGTHCRDWRKLHLGVDAKGQIVASVLTGRHEDDAATLGSLLEQIEVPVDRFTADGAYDERPVYAQLEQVGTEEVAIVIPPRSNAVEADPCGTTWDQRSEAVRTIQAFGQQAWEKASGYRQQGRAENTFFRYKKIIGTSLRSQTPDAQQREVQIACKILNQIVLV